MGNGPNANWLSRTVEVPLVLLRRQRWARLVIVGAGWLSRCTRQKLASEEASSEPASVGIGALDGSNQKSVLIEKLKHFA